jgi:hypothetical protein
LICRLQGISEWRSAGTAFQKRHLVAHKTGIVDVDYITKTGDTRAIVGRKIGIDATEVREFAKTISKIAVRLSNDLQVLEESS